MGTISITEPWIKKATANPDPSSERARWWDNSLPGYGVILGKRFATFVVQHRVNGKQELTSIGRYGYPGARDESDPPDEKGKFWTEARARREARRVLGKMSSGISPNAIKIASSNGSEPTLRDAYEAHLERLRRKNRSEATIATLEKEVPKYLSAWLDRPISELHGSDLVKLHEQIKRDARAREGTNPDNPRGAPLANRVIAQVSACWNTLNKKLEGKLGNWNPAKSVERDTLKPKRERIAAVDLPDWYKRVQTMRNPIQSDGLVFALFTGLRSEDVRTIRFEHADLKTKTLSIPDPKGGESRAFEIPLPATCIAILKRRKIDNADPPKLADGSYPYLFPKGDGGYVFPGFDKDGQVCPISDLRQQVHDGAKHSRFPVEDVHTLRRTYESIAHEEGVNEMDQHVLTNHSYSSHNVNATYISQHMDHLRACQTKIEAGLKKRLKITLTK